MLSESACRILVGFVLKSFHTEAAFSWKSQHKSRHGGGELRRSLAVVESKSTCKSYFLLATRVERWLAAGIHLRPPQNR